MSTITVGGLGGGCVAVYSAATFEATRAYSELDASTLLELAMEVTGLIQGLCSLLKWIEWLSIFVHE